MCRIWIGVPQEVCEGDGRKGVVVGEGGFVELDHYDYERCITVGALIRDSANLNSD